MKSKGSGKLSFMSKVAYGSGNLAANLMNCTVGTYISFYYTEVAGLPIAAVGVILLICRILDGLTDLGIGAIVERTNTKYGKARPWVLRMAIPFGISVFLMFFSPGFGVTGKIIYAAATYMAGIAIVYTAVSVPYNTLSALVTQDQDERTSLATMRQFFGFVGPLVITTISMPVINALGAGQMAWSILAGIYGVIGSAIYLWVFFSVKEIDVDENKETIKIEKGNFILEIKALFKNQYWMIVLIVTLVIFMNYGVKAGVQLYYSKYVLGDSNFYSLMSVASQIPNILCCFIIPAIARKFGKRNISMIGCVIAVIGGLIMVINPESRSLILVSTVINSIGMAPIAICCFAMLGDTAVYGEWKTNIRNEGLVFSATTFGEKAGNALGGAIAAFALAIGGFVGNATAQSASAIGIMKLCMIGFPVLVAIVIIIALKFYNLDKLYPTILKDLEERKQKEYK